MKENMITVGPVDMIIPKNTRMLRVAAILAAVLVLSVASPSAAAVRGPCAPARATDGVLKAILQKHLQRRKVRRKT